MRAVRYVLGLVAMAGPVLFMLFIAKNGVLAIALTIISLSVAGGCVIVVNTSPEAKLARRKAAAARVAQPASRPASSAPRPTGLQSPAAPRRAGLLPRSVRALT